jgi:hypothetical protein
MCHVGPVIQSSGFGGWESAPGCIFTPSVGPFACSGIRSLGFTSHSEDEAIKVKWPAQGHKRGGPQCSYHGSATLTTTSWCPSVTFACNCYVFVIVKQSYIFLWPIDWSLPSLKATVALNYTKLSLLIRRWILHADRLLLFIMGVKCTISRSHCALLHVGRKRERE